MRALFSSSRFYFSERKINYSFGSNGVESYMIKSRKLAEVLSLIHTAQRLYKAADLDKISYDTISSYSSRMRASLDYLHDNSDWTYIFLGSNRNGVPTRIFIEWHDLCYNGFRLFNCFLDLHRITEEAYEYLSGLPYLNKKEGEK
jgi:hypothetical protein